MAAECAWAGHEVTLVEAPEFAAAIAGVRESHTVEVFGRGPDPVPAKLAGATTNVAAGVRWGLVFGVANQLSRIVVGLVLVRLLTPSDYGLAAIAFVCATQWIPPEYRRNDLTR